MQEFLEGLKEYRGDALGKPGLHEDSWGVASLGLGQCQFRDHRSRNSFYFWECASPSIDNTTVASCLALGVLSCLKRNSAASAASIRSGALNIGCVGTPNLESVIVTITRGIVTRDVRHVGRVFQGAQTSLKLFRGLSQLQ